MSSVQNGTYGFGTVLTADKEALDVEQPTKKARVLPPATSANEAIQFHFVDGWKQIPTKHQDLNRETGTEPYFTNQVFEEEEIQGYQGLEIDIVLDTAEYIPRLFHKHSFKAEKRADDCVSLISTHFTEGLPTAPAECAAMHEQGPTLEEVVKGCELVHQFSHDISGEKGVDCRIVHSIPATASEALRTLHARIHPLLLFYIDGSSGLQQEDANMNLLLLVKYAEGKPVGVLGMLTFFELYAFPTEKRFRVAQMLIMPPFQKQGLGREMLTAVNKMAQGGKEGVSDIAYEDAAEPLQALRERMDAEAAAAIPEVWERAQQCVQNACKAIANGGASQNGAATGGTGASGSSGAGPSSAVNEEDGNESSLGAGEHDALEALQVGKETACVLRKQLKLVPQQVQVVWDVLLWVAAMRSKICSQDAITDLLQARVMQRELIEVAEQIAKAPAQGDTVPPNKVVLDGDILEALEEEAVEKDNLTWQEKHGEAPQPATPTAAEPVGEGQEGEEENVEEKGEDAEIAPTVGSLTYVMFRSDRRSKTARKEKGVRAAPAVEWASLNDEAKESIVEIVNDRREAIERISHGMRWP